MADHRKPRAEQKIHNREENLFSRTQSIKWIAAVGLFFTIVNMVFLSMIYIQNPAKPLLVLEGISVVVLLFWIISYLLTSRNQAGWAGILILASVVILYSGYESVMSRSTLSHLISGLALLLFFSLVCFPKKWWIGVIAAGLLSLSIWTLNQYEPLTHIHPFYFIVQFSSITRLDISQVFSLQYFAPISTAMILFFGLTGVMYLRIGDTIRNRLLFSFVAIVLLSLVVISTVTVLLNIQRGQVTVVKQLEIVSRLKENQIDSLLSRMQAELDAVYSNPDNNARIREILLTPPDKKNSADFQINLFSVYNVIQDTVNKGDLFEDVFLATLQGDHIVSSDQTLEDQTLAKLEWPFYQPALYSRYISPLFLIHPTANQRKYSVIIGIPVQDTDKKPLGILAGRINISKLYEILLEPNGLDNTGEAYLISADDNMLTPSRFTAWKNLQGYAIHSPGIDTSHTRKTGYGNYLAYRNRQVFGYYRYLTTLRVNLMVEQETSEALQSVYQGLGISVGISIIVLIIAIIASLFVSRSIANPLDYLSRTASRIAAGELNIRANVNRTDEIGSLAKTFNSMTDQLKNLIDNLEQRVADRTAQVEKRAVQLQAAGQVARDIAMAENLDQLLNNAVDLIRDRFGFYHAGIFLADERKEFAVLKAATGDAGKEMLSRNHQLQIGRTGIVGYVVGSGEPRIALDVGEDAVHFRNPILPQTRSEMALPLRIEDETIGALDVQSTEPSAFAEDDINILQTMADQLAVAIEKARILEKLQLNVQELESTYQSYTRESWKNFLQNTRSAQGYRYRNAQVEAYVELSPGSTQALLQGTSVITQIVTNNPDKGIKGFVHLAVPIRIRNQVLGVINLSVPEGSLSQDLQLWVENISTRLALALENARLLEEIQISAERDQMVSNITTKVRASTNIDGILKTAVAELGKALGVSEVLIQLRPPE